MSEKNGRENEGKRKKNHVYPKLQLNVITYGKKKIFFLAPIPREK